MGKVYDRIDDRLREWMLAQPVVFVATAPVGDDGHVNVSPKGGAGSVTVLDPGTVAYLDYTGSGVETIAHLRENGRITLMWCAFDGPPKIVRVHGRGSVVLPGSARWPSLTAHFPGADDPAVRAVIVVEAERISDSCGYGVPLMDLRADRDVLERWSARKGPAGLSAYRREKNAESIDGLPGLEGPEQ
jgi:predicted pyridoxine 5'-phosphate oxidase superfamily flavin-nucleotide-binding protein